MRHGRKSKRFDGYERHVARGLDAALILACAETPANRPESEAAPKLADDMRNQGVKFGLLNVDRASITSSLVEDVQAQNGEIACQPWVARNGKLFAKVDFHIDTSASTITCLAGETATITLGTVVQFDADTRDDCRIRDACTSAQPGTGRQVSWSACMFLLLTVPPLPLRRLPSMRRRREMVRQLRPPASEEPAPPVRQPA